MNFTALADELDRQEFARLSAAITPRIEVFCSMTREGFRDQIALMMERLGHEIVTLAPWLVTMKEGRKCVTACANPADLAPVKMPAIGRLHDAVIAASAYKGIYVTPRSFTPDVEHYADHAPIQLVDGRMFIKSMQLSRKGLLLPQTYKAMCRQPGCGEIVQHRLDKDEALPCPNGHFVPPSQSRAKLIPYRPPTPAAQPAAPNPAPAYALHPVGPHPTGAMPSVIKPRVMTPKAQRRRAIKAHNRKLQARAIKQQV
jgi:Restriction endonuclease